VVSEDEVGHSSMIEDLRAFKILRSHNYSPDAENVKFEI